MISFIDIHKSSLNNSISLVFLAEVRVIKILYQTYLHLITIILLRRTTFGKVAGLNFILAAIYAAFLLAGDLGSNIS